MDATPAHNHRAFAAPEFGTASFAAFAEHKIQLSETTKEELRRMRWIVDESKRRRAACIPMIECGGEEGEARPIMEFPEGRGSMRHQCWKDHISSTDEAWPAAVEFNAWQRWGEP